MLNLLEKGADGYERIVYAEVIIPDSLNTYGDFHTKDSVREFAYTFMQQGFGIDLEHDGIDRSDGITVVESFIAREGDTDFTEGSWVIGMHIGNDEVWGKILNGELNGFSYEAIINTCDIGIKLPDSNIMYGRTEPDLLDGHTHGFIVFLDDNGRVMYGGTAMENNHSHDIVSTTFTEYASGHSHIYNFVKPVEVENG